LLGVDFGYADDEVADAGHDADALGDRDGAAGVEEVEGVRALEGQLVGAHGWEGGFAARRIRRLSWRRSLR
jgi:hypothetical protein